MPTKLKLLFTGFLIAGILAGPALHGQTPNLTFSYLSAGKPNSVTVVPGGIIDFQSVSIGKSGSVTITIDNLGTVGVGISINSISGGPFTTLSNGTVNISPNGSGAISLSFTPTAAGPVNGVLILQSGTGQTYPFTLSGTGIAPTFITSYIINPNGNQIPADDGGLISFPQTTAGGQVTATFVITNRGNGPGSVNAVTVTGDGFKLSGLPLLPAQVDPGNELRFTLSFAPTAKNAYQGSIRIDFDRSTRTISLAGTGVAAVLTYETIADSGPQTVAPNGTITFPQTPVGSSSSLVLRVRNTGNTSGQVNTVTLVGAPIFAVTGLIPLPVTLSPGDAMTFTISFLPRDSGNVSGRLLIDNVILNLQSTGLGAKLALSVTSGGTSSDVANNGTSLFPNTTVGALSSASINVKNSGNVGTTVSSVSLTGSGFLISSQPNLPVTLAPEAAFSFVITFAPQSVGSATGILQIEDQTINFRGIGSAPPSLPEYSYTGLGSSAAPLDQPTIGLTLANSYPYDITGNLTLTFSSDSFVDDTAIQFASGGRSVSFRIPANTRTAQFGNSSAVAFQTGTVAGTITFSASFATAAVDITPNSNIAKTVQIAALAPQLRAVQIGTRSATSFEVLVTGFSTTRSLNSFNLSFTAAPGTNLQTTSLSISVDAPFSAWYQTAVSRTAGSQFTVSITIQISGDANAVQSVSVVAVNSVGSSNNMSASLR